MASNRGYKIRSYANGKYKNYLLTVPNEIAEALPKNMIFVPKMTDEGLLYQPQQEVTIELPAWAKENKSDE